MTTENAAECYKKADELATAAIKKRATFWEVRKACIEAMKWQYDYDKVEPKDESIIQMDKTVFERVQSVCRYRCAKIGDTYKCAKGKSFGETCERKNCKIL